MKKKLLSTLLISHIVLLIHAQGYNNPIIPGFYPDPSICLVRKDYYLVNSSFEFFPGIPIWHSYDLVRWKQIGNVLNRFSQLDLRRVKKSDGLGAATIRYHNGTYYLAVTESNHGFKNFFVTATNPAGPWSDPIQVDQGGIDASMFFDDDGKVYFQTNRAHQFSDERAIYQSEIDVKSGKRLTEIKQLWKGSGGSYVEGPHIYKHAGFYYCLTAEGGTSYGHSVAIARSKSIWGPYQGCPFNPILTNRMSYSGLQGIGHADLFQANDGSWWMVHLGFRPAVDGVHTIGRETCLTPVEWNSDGWPVVNTIGMADLEEKISPPKYNGTNELAEVYGTTNFDKPLGFEWVFIRNPDSANYSLKQRTGFLSLKGSVFTLDSVASPTFLGIRQRHFNVNISSTLNYLPQNQNEEAGITVYMCPFFHYDCYVTAQGNQKFINLRYTLESIKQVCAHIPIANGAIKIVINTSKTSYNFSVTDSAGVKHSLGTLPSRFLGTEVAGGFTGIMIGLYATGNGKNSTSDAFFDDFEYSPIDK